MKTISDLRGILFDTINDVRDGKTDKDRAKLVVDIAQTIVNTAKVEVDFMRVTDETHGTGFIPSSKEPSGELQEGVVRVVRHRLMG